MRQEYWVFPCGRHLADAPPIINRNPKLVTISLLIFETVRHSEAMQVATSIRERSGNPLHNQSGRWVTELEYSKLHSIGKQTLCNWRYKDNRAGRTEAQPGYPK